MSSRNCCYCCKYNLKQNKNPQILLNAALLHTNKLYHFLILAKMTTEQQELRTLWKVLSPHKLVLTAFQEGNYGNITFFTPTLQIGKIKAWRCNTLAAAAKSLQSCPTLCDPIDGSPPGSPVPGILHARTLQRVAIFFSNAWKWKVKVKSLSHFRLLVTAWTAAHQAPPSMGFSRQEYRSGLPLPSPTTLLGMYYSYQCFQMWT